MMGICNCVIFGFWSLFWLSFEDAQGSRILILNPEGFSSHFRGSISIGKALARRGHHVTAGAMKVLLDDVGGEKQDIPPNMELLPMQFSLSHETLSRTIDKYVRSTLRGYAPNEVIDELPPTIHPDEDKYTIFNLCEVKCSDVLEDDKLLSRLRAAKYDIIVGDTVYLCHPLLSQILSVPFIHIGLTTMVPSQHDIFAGNPVNPAYVPERTTELTDTMTFRQRLKNTAMYQIMKYLYNKYVLQLYQNVQLSSNVKPDMTFRQLMSTAEMWIFSSNFLIDFPRPLPSHVVFVGGVLTGPPKPLIQELDVFANNSGDAGIIVVAMGTLISSQLTAQQAEAIATSLSLLPQKVVWAFVGSVPSSVGDNILIRQKIPQNDLLAHPKVRAFVSHGGINSCHESIYHGVPVVCMPVFGDQGDNCVRLQAKGMAIIVDIKNLLNTTLYDAITKIIQNTRYKETALHMSQIVKDRVSGMSPVDEIAYWIEYAIKHGTEHLKPRALQLSVIEYYMLDVLAIHAVFVIVILLCIKYTCCTRKKQL
ncbi:UDP-glucuronosyltransferase 2C1-like [Acanthaster planci]|uniref:UDP-glucuronosyltransferase 2C1-like n=1 Tax=Acanthaster planci TaxID=133434 RepID=A0A8B7Z4L4_ACAPL|nr:UDP-glucuronosyltransferase 2C1-like [Acanthaster planci]